MKLPDRIEGPLFRAVLGLPAPLLRPVGGRPLRCEGQTLAPDLQAMLRMMRLTGEPELGAVPVAQSRALYRRQTVLAGGDQPIGSVRDLAVGDRRGRLYTPRGVSEVGPLLVWFHGGGFLYGDLDTHDPACRYISERSGVRVLSVDYRLGPEAPFPAAFDDVAAAYRWVVAHAADLDADPARLAVGGDSAGGTLAAYVALVAAREALPLAFQALVYPATDSRGDTETRRRYNHGLVLTQHMFDEVTAHFLVGEDDELDPRASPVLAEIPEGVAPAYVVTAGFDPLRDEGETYARRLADAGVALELQRFPDQLHGFVHLVGVSRSGRAATQAVADRVADALRPAEATDSRRSA
jgi:acetyl esterase